jgi:hypothetical protein
LESQLPTDRSTLVVMVGPPGSGKSHLVGQIAAQLGAAVVSTDAVRKELFPRPRYTPAEMGAVYAECHRRLATGLGSGRVVIFDATNLQERNRKALYQIAERAKAKLVVVSAFAPEAIVRARLAQRLAARTPGDLSDADEVVYERLRKSMEPIRVPHIVANTTVAVAPLVRRLRMVVGPG